MPKIVPCLWFDTEAEEAARFYVSVFPNSTVTGVTRYGPGAHRPEGLALTVSFTLDGQEYLALNSGPEFTSPTMRKIDIAALERAADGR